MGEAMRPIALVVEDDAMQRTLVATLLEESDMKVIECESAEAATLILDKIGSHVTMLFTDLNLAGRQTGADLASIAKRRFPDMTVVVTSGNEQPKLPRDAAFLRKPWRALDILRHAEKSRMSH